jgi:hypothetical protein
MEKFQIDSINPRETPRRMGRLSQVCHQVFGEFIGLFDAVDKR